jgi:hypothetical protein
MAGLNSKNVHHVKIYLPCYFEVNPITHVGVISPFHQIFNILILFEKREITPKWVTGFTSKLHGRQILTC